MSFVQIIRVALQCDGCTAIYGTPVGRVNPIEARAAAYAEGWRFPALVNRNGEESQTSSSDVCPDCMPEWRPTEHRPGQRKATDAELREWTP